MWSPTISVGTMLRDGMSYRSMPGPPKNPDMRSAKNDAMMTPPIAAGVIQIRSLLRVRAFARLSPPLSATPNPTAMGSAIKQKGRQIFLPAPIA